MSDLTREEAIEAVTRAIENAVPFGDGDAYARVAVEALEEKGLQFGADDFDRALNYVVRCCETLQTEIRKRGHDGARVLFGDDHFAIYLKDPAGIFRVKSLDEAYRLIADFDKHAKMESRKHPTLDQLAATLGVERPAQAAE